MNSVKVLISGAAGKIGYSILSMIANGKCFNNKTKVSLHLLDLPVMLNRLQGIKMEIEDCCYSLINEVHITSSYEEACKGVDWAILIGGFSKPRGIKWEDFERKDLLNGNVPIFSKTGKALNEYASKNVRVVVAANPANTNALTVMKNAPKIPKENITALTRLDMNRAIAFISREMHCSIEEVEKVYIWGNHSRTLVADLNHVSVKGSLLSEEFKKNNEKEFMGFVRDRFSEVVKKLGMTSVMSAANAICDHVHDWYNGTEDGKYVSMGVISDGNPYGVEDDLIYSFPLSIKDGKWEMIKNIVIKEEINKYLKESEKELIEEKELGKI